MKKLLALLLALMLITVCFTSCSILNFNKGEEGTQNGEDPSNGENTPNDGNNENNEQEGNENAECNHVEAINSAVEPTCTETGLTEGKYCSVCGETILPQEIVPAQHTYGDWNVITEGDCLIPGEKTRTCVKCGDVETAKTVDSAHSFVQNEETGLFGCENCGAIIFKGHLYAAFETQMNWFDAYKFCDSLGGYLLTITSLEEQEAINSLVSSREIYIPDSFVEFYYWTGLYRTSKPIWKWITGEDLIYENWSSKEPDSDDEQWFMAIATTHVASSNSHAKPGQWEDVSHGAGDDAEGLICEWELDIVCDEHFFTEWKTVTEATCFSDGERYRFCTHCGLTENEVLSQLEHNFVLNEESGITSCEYCNAATYDGRIYKIFDDSSLCWFDAYAYCDDLGGHLATITSADEQQFIKDYMSSLNFKSKIWLGGYNDGHNWYWVTDEEFEYTNWQSNQPNHADGVDWIVLMNPNTSTIGQWNDYSPLTKVYFLCEWEAE